MSVKSDSPADEKDKVRGWCGNSSKEDDFPYIQVHDFAERKNLNSRSKLNLLKEDTISKGGQ